ncbi:MAG: TolC family protein, partial [Muriicola sp.]|nr:TolC family protein [Muriicola sp.]
EKSEALKGAAFAFDKTEIYYSYDENNIAVNGFPIDVFGIKQDFQFPTVYGAQRKVQNRATDLEQRSYEIETKRVIRDLTKAYYDYQIKRQKEIIYGQLDSLYKDFDRAAQRRFELGETNYLEKVTATAKQRQIIIRKNKAIEEVKQAHNTLRQILQIGDTVVILEEPEKKMILENPSLEEMPELAFYRDRALLLKAETRLERQRLLPDIGLAYFQGSNSTLNDNLTGYQIGLKIPVLFGGQASRIKASTIEKEAFAAQSREYESLINTKLKLLQANFVQNKNALRYYDEEGKVLSEEILKTASKSFRSGEIDFFQYIQSIENAYEIMLNYLDSLNAYNQTIIEINYLTL